MKWIQDNNPPFMVKVEIRIRHCNKKLELKDEFVQGMIKDDGFYFLDGGELSYNWDIIAWRKL